MYNGDEMGGDDMEQQIAVQALEEIENVCKSYRGMLPKKDEEKPAEVEKTTVSVEAPPEHAAEAVEALEDEPGEEMAEESSEPAPISIVSYGNAPAKRSPMPPQEQKRGRGRPRKGF